MSEAPPNSSGMNTSGAAAALAGAAVITGAIMLVSAIAGYESGVTGSIVLFSLSAGISSSTLMAHLAGRRGRRIDTVYLVANAVLSVVLVYLASSWLTSSIS